MQNVQLAFKVSLHNSKLEQAKEVVGSTDWFNCNQDELLDELSKSPAKETSFADDLEFAVRGPTKMGCRDGAQDAINTAVRWANRTGLEFSPSKTHVMFLTKRRDKGNKKAKPTGPLFLYGQELKYVDTVDHLGIRIDSRLSWNSHLDNKIMKTKRCMLMCRNVLSKMYEPKPLYMRWLYTSVIRPQLTYGCYAWAQATKTAKNREKLEKFERMVLTFIRHTTPTDALRIMYNIKPLHLFIRETAMKTYFRVKKYNWLPRNPDMIGHDVNL